MQLKKLAICIPGFHRGASGESGTVLFLHISPVPTASEQTTRVNLLQHLSSVQLLSCVRLFLTPWTAARQASLSITTSQSLLKLMSIESVMPSNHVVLCHAILLLPSIFKGSSWGRTLVEAGRGEGQPAVLKGKGSYFSLCFPNSEETTWFSSISLLTLLHRWSPNVWNFGTKQFSNCRNWNPYNLIQFWHYLPGASTDSPRLRAPSYKTVNPHPFQMPPASPDCHLHL